MTRLDMKQLYILVIFGWVKTWCHEVRMIAKIKQRPYCVHWFTPKDSFEADSMKVHKKVP